MSQSQLKVRHVTSAMHWRTDVRHAVPVFLHDCLKTSILYQRNVLNWIYVLFQLPISGYIFVDRNFAVNAAWTPTNEWKRTSFFLSFDRNAGLKSDIKEKISLVKKLAKSVIKLKLEGQILANCKISNLINKLFVKTESIDTFVPCFKTLFWSWRTQNWNVGMQKLS